MFQTFISRHNSNFFSDKLVLTSVTPASSAPVLQTPKATSSTLYFDSLTVNAGNGGFLHCIQMDTSVNAANQVVSVGAAIAFDADPKFFACLVRFESSSFPTTLPAAYDVYPLAGRHDGGYYTVKDCLTIDDLPRTPSNNVHGPPDNRQAPPDQPDNAEDHGSDSFPPRSARGASSATA